MENLGDTIAALRKKQGMSQKELAEKLQLTESAVCKWERGQRCPDILTIRRLAEVLQISSDGLLGMVAQPEMEGAAEIPIMVEEVPIVEEVSETVEAPVITEAPAEITRAKKKGIKGILITGVTLILCVVVGIIWYQDNYPSTYKVVTGRYIEDELYGSVYEMAVVVHKDREEGDIGAYIEAIHTAWDNGEYGDLGTKVVKISFYDSKGEALKFAETDVFGYMFQVTLE